MPTPKKKYTYTQSAAFVDNIAFLPSQVYELDSSFSMLERWLAKGYLVEVADLESVSAPPATTPKLSAAKPSKPSSTAGAPTADKDKPDKAS